MANIDYLFVAMGNPGSEYEFTRHNIGFRVLSDFLKNYSDLEIVRTDLHSTYIFKNRGKLIACMFPTTYMNRIGNAITSFMKNHSLQLDNIFVIVDEYNFPLGKLHLKKGGSDGGHNGIASVMNSLNSPLFWRLRCGIDKNFSQGGLVDYVLGNFNTNEEEDVQLMISNGTLALKQIIKESPIRAMNSINSGTLFKSE